jgi:hypothetical protein
MMHKPSSNELNRKDAKNAKSSFFFATFASLRFDSVAVRRLTPDGERGAG